MKITINKPTEVDVKKLRVRVGVRYWEDATINGSDDTENGDNIPCKDGDYWCPIIDIDTGRILNWETGKSAYLHYKVCDDGKYTICTEDDKDVFHIDGYVVPPFMSPGGNGYVDYIYMTINSDGYIQDWNFNIEDMI